MKKTRLGLPLEYSKLHQYFDELSSGESEATNRVVESILKKHKVKSVLDLTCGTGSQVLYLAERGYSVTGSDISPALLATAKKKNKKIAFLEGDMRTIQVGHFDAVITIFNAIGHLTKTGFEKALKNIARNLNPGGLYVFDIFNLAAMDEKAVKELDMDIRKTVKGTSIHQVQYSELDRESGQLTSFDQYVIDGKTIKSKFTLQIYTAKELREVLAKHGFETLGQYDIDGGKFLERKTPKILTVAVKN